MFLINKAEALLLEMGFKGYRQQSVLFNRRYELKTPWVRVWLEQNITRSADAGDEYCVELYIQNPDRGLEKFWYRVRDAEGLKKRLEEHGFAATAALRLNRLNALIS